MNALRNEPLDWSWRKWWTVILVVFAVHLGLAYALSERQPLAPPPVIAAPMLRVVSEPNELLALNDATLFALPHPRSFAAPAWLSTPKVDFPVFRWREPERMLDQPRTEPLGDTFRQFMQTNTFVRFELETLPAPRLPRTETPPGLSLAGRSELLIQGALANRRLLNPPELPSWPATDLLTNTVVQLRVTATGNVFTFALLPPGSGSAAADQFALNATRSARFTPLPQTGNPLASPAANLTEGTLVFVWHTIPPPATNAPAATP
ncbi:MAG: hypothetical protein KIS67_06660 [Verrucomicrobiae bacterium]|nr:hypothetical protein [Verrucomicrobiae bacterium]